MLKNGDDWIDTLCSIYLIDWDNLPTWQRTFFMKIEKTNHILNSETVLFGICLPFPNANPSYHFSRPTLRILSTACWSFCANYWETSKNLKKIPSFLKNTQKGGLIKKIIIESCHQSQFLKIIKYFEDVKRILIILYNFLQFECAYTYEYTQIKAHQMIVLKLTKHMCIYIFSLDGELSFP